LTCYYFEKLDVDKRAGTLSYGSYALPHGI